jgi:hypothetical protein
MKNKCDIQAVKNWIFEIYVQHTLGNYKWFYEKLYTSKQREKKWYEHIRRKQVYMTMMRTVY